MVVKNPERFFLRLAWWLCWSCMGLIILLTAGSLVRLIGGRLSGSWKPVSVGTPEARVTQDFWKPSFIVELPKETPGGRIFFYSDFHDDGVSIYIGPSGVVEHSYWGYPFPSTSLSLVPVFFWGGVYGLFLLCIALICWLRREAGPWRDVSFLLLSFASGFLSLHVLYHASLSDRDWILSLLFLLFSAVLLVGLAMSSRTLFRDAP